MIRARNQGPRVTRELTLVGDDYIEVKVDRLKGVFGKNKVAGGILINLRAPCATATTSMLRGVIRQEYDSLAPPTTPVPRPSSSTTPDPRPLSSQDQPIVGKTSLQGYIRFAEWLRRRLSFTVDT